MSFNFEHGSFISFPAIKEKTLILTFFRIISTTKLKCIVIVTFLNT